MAGDMHPPIIGGAVGSVAHLHGIRQGAFAQCGDFVFVRCGRKFERFHDGFQTGEGGGGIHGEFSFQAGFWSAAK